MTDHILPGVVADSRERQALTCSTGRSSLHLTPASVWFSAVCLTRLLCVLPMDEGV